MTPTRYGVPSDFRPTSKILLCASLSFSSIFSRAIGFNALLSEPPPLEILSRDFLLNYHRYGDLLYQAFMEAETHSAITTANFRFQLYASGEYSRLLESEWEQQG